jgi:hypothetical protein
MLRIHNESFERIIFIKPFNATFILSDQNILEKHFQVKPYLLNTNRKRIFYPWIMLKLFIFLVINEQKSDTIATWFAEYYSLFVVFVARLFK